jgi:outer membrane protein OmpA-like peptidoglycan-associated protein/subtilisin family serine protease
MRPAIKILSSIAAFALFTALASDTAVAQGEVKDVNEIIHGLAPIKYSPQYQGREARPSIDLYIQFAIDKATLLPEAVQQLEELGRALQSAKLQNKKMEIAGHTDSTGSSLHNRRLSLRRAERVATYLQQEFKIDRMRLSVAGYGEARPKDPLHSDSAVNRRVEIISSGSIKTSKSDSKATASESKVQSVQKEGGDLGWGDLLSNTEGAQNLLRQAEAQGTARVIIVLAGAKQAEAQAKGWRNLNDYIRDLQDKAIDRLGWTNINDLVRYDYTPAMAMTVNAARLRELLRGDAVEQVYEDKGYNASLSKSAPLIGSKAAKFATHNGAGWGVAVLDTGVDSNHPFLKEKVIAEACFSSEDTKWETVIRSACPSGKRVETGPGAARPCVAAYGCAHGTHVAGIVAGQNGEFTGVASEASIIAVQVFSLVETHQSGKDSTAYMSDILRGLEWVYHNRERYKIASVNLSLGGGRFHENCDRRSPFTRIMELLAQSDIASVVASGNQGYPGSISSPACVTTAISVGATTYRDNVAAFSNSAHILDFLAPGATEQKIDDHNGILSSVPGAGFKRFQGTSAAAPHVSGAFAVLKSALPTATFRQMREALRVTGRKIIDPRNGVTFPRIQLDEAVKFLLRNIVNDTPNPLPEVKVPPVSKSKNYGGIRVFDGKEKEKNPFN